MLCFHHLSPFLNPTLEPVNCLYDYALRPKTFDVMRYDFSVPLQGMIYHKEVRISSTLGGH